jgi:uncharacterized protein (TIGR00299 family) protein
VIGWLDCAAGASGDMLLGALVDAGVPLAVLRSAVDALGTEPIRLTAEPATRHGIGGTRVHVTAEEAPGVTRRWADVRALLTGSALAEDVRERALDTFGRLARAEAAVHRVPPEDVHFHEVGALDALADIVGTCAGVAWLRAEHGLDRLVCGTVSTGSGYVRGRHGMIPTPAPAVLGVLAEAGLPVQAGAAPYELCTPTGAALLASLVSAAGPLPPMTVTRTGHGAGTRDMPEVPNLLRLVLGAPVPGSGPGAATALLLEANIDDLDPRVWPGVLAALLRAGAADAWLSPITMKKGRPAHTVHMLCAEDRAEAVRRAVFTETTTIGLREHRVAKHALPRAVSTVDVDGQPVRVKTAYLAGEPVNTSVEYEDVVAAAATLGLPAKTVLAKATAAAQDLVTRQTSAKNVSDPLT